MIDPVEEAASALAQDPARAERLALALAARNPHDPRLRLIRASALRRKGDARAALPMLLELAKAWPRAARTRYELGLCLNLLGRPTEGLGQLETAVEIDPQFTEAWQALADFAFSKGHFELEIRAKAAIAKLAVDNPVLAEAAEAVALGRFATAEPVLRRHLLAQPDDVEGLRLLAECLCAERAYEQAETLLRHALALEPDLALARFNLACTLFSSQQAELALRELAPLEANDPNNAAYRNLRAGCLALLGDETGAEALHNELADQFPANPRIAVNHGHALRTKGNRDEAIASYRRAIALQPQNGEAWWSLANLKVGALTASDEEVMRRLLQDGSVGELDRMRLSYALGRRLEDAGEYAESFDWYARGAVLARQRITVQGADYEASAETVRQCFNVEFFTQRSGWGVDDASPIFVLGLPRSGSTLVEQILASHPDIEGTMELPYIGAIASRLALRGEDAVAELSKTAVRELGEEYLAKSAIHRRLGRKHFIDKMPNNLRHIGLIRLILPKARIVDVRRFPLASCLSCFKQLFAEGHDYSYDLRDLGNYYRHYLRLIRHFSRIQPFAIHTQIYEDLVEATEEQIGRLLDAIGVAFSPDCLRFYENSRAVRTVSSEQVRQPIYRSGLDHWRAYADFLNPLEESLGEALVDWRQ
jgi:tetratricopeptide (TPR) repeat protein